MKTRLGLRLAVGAAAALAVGFVALSAASAKRSAVDATIPLLRIGYVLTPGTLDRAKTDSACCAVQGGSLELLMKLGPDGKVQPNLARSVTRPSAATYVYHLRRGVRFWDGTE